jgi:hypothetical protein
VAPFVLKQVDHPGEALAQDAGFSPVEVST